MNSEERAREAALRRLSSRLRTEKEIQDHLKSLDFSEEDVNSALAFLKEYNYIDDSEYCRHFYAASRQKGWAKYRIIRELEQRGIATAFAKAVFEDLDDEAYDDREAALKIGLKMARQQGREICCDRKFLARVGRRLAGLGYSSDICYYVMSKVKDYGKENE